MDVIDPVFLRSPELCDTPLDSALGCRLVLKDETRNPIHCFKGRGASLYSAELDGGRRVVCASAGNFGQAMAWACRARGIPLTVHAGVHANPLKIERMRTLGAKVVLYGTDFDAAKDEARSRAAAAGDRYVEDGREPAIAEGAGTIGVELLASGDPPDAVILPLGNGALLTGVGRWIKARAPGTRVVGVCAAGAPSMAESWRSGRVVTHTETATIADGIAVRVPVPEALADMAGTVDDVLLVSEASLHEAMRLLYRNTGLAAEPAGAAGVAALLEHRAQFQGRTVATVLCGGNLTEVQKREWLG